MSEFDYGVPVDMVDIENTYGRTHMPAQKPNGMMGTFFEDDNKKYITIIFVLLIALAFIL